MKVIKLLVGPLFVIIGIVWILILMFMFAQYEYAMCVNSSNIISRKDELSKAEVISALSDLRSQSKKLNSIVQTQVFPIAMIALGCVLFAFNAKQEATEAE
jgi:hypothetical protein